jgi:ABC-type polysaccharide/polyol phosphate export permease
VNLLIGLAIYFALFFILKGTPTIFILLLPLAILLQVMFTLSPAFFPYSMRYPPFGTVISNLAPLPGSPVSDIVIPVRASISLARYNP